MPLRRLPLLVALISAVPAPAAPITSESQVTAYTLPDVLHHPAAPAPIATAADWETQARPALLDAFSAHIYGRTPPLTDLRVATEDLATAEILDGKALLRQTRLRFHRGDRSVAIDVLVVLPRHASPERPAPTIVGLNFWGNHTVHPAPSIRVPAPVPGMEPKERGSYARRWPLDTFIDRGHALVTAFRGEIVPDNGAHHAEGVLALFPENTGESRMGAIGAWAWALSRLADHASTLPEIDASRLTVVGHSRLGKAALWAAAQDTRFSAVFANNSGCMGASLSRRRFGETVAIITCNFPYWFAPRLASYADREDELPVDQHQLLALIAPRPVHLGSASEDLWADPRGELLALRAAAPAYALHGIETSLPDQLPPPDATPLGTILRFHLRAGPHDLLPTDWQAYLGSPSSTARPPGSE
jgi:hypothetical protein